MSEQTTPVNASDVVILDLKNLSGAIQFRVNINGELQWKLLTDSTWFTITSLELLRGRSLTNVAVNAQNKFVLSFSDLTTQTLSIAALEDAITRAVAAATQALASAGAATAVAQGTATAKPTSKPVFSIDFANSKFLDPQFTFTRPSIATYIDRNGLMKIATSNRPRFTHDANTLESLGILLEGVRTNFLTFSTDISTYTRGSNTNYVGATTLLGFQAHTFSSSQTSNAFVTKSYPLTIGKTYTYSFYADSSVLSYIKLLKSDTTLIRIQNDFVVTTIKDNVYRHEITFTAGTDEATVLLHIGPVDKILTYTVGMVQLEEGAFSTSYIPTSTTAVTRNSDIIIITSPNFESRFGQVEQGSIQLEGISKGIGESEIMSFNAADDAGGWNKIRYLLGANNGRFEITKSGVVQSNVAASVNNAVGFSIIASFASNLTHLTVNGTKGTPITTGLLPSGITNFKLSTQFVARIKYVAFYKSVLPDVQLVQLTTSTLLSGRKANQLPTNLDIHSAGYVNPYSILRTMGKNEYSIDGTGASITRTIRRPYAFTFEIIDSSGVTSIITNPSGSCNADTDYPLTFTAPVGKCITYAITPVFEY